MKYQNIFCAVVAAAILPLTGGCKSDPKDKEVSTLHFHIEISADGTDVNHPVPIFRERPTYVNVQDAAFLDERDVDQVEVLGSTEVGFVIHVQFNNHGKLVLESLTRSNPGKRIAINSSFNKENRWLAAPRITRGIGNGSLTFTPDATEDEARHIAQGVNNLVREVKKKSRFSAF